MATAIVMLMCNPACVQFAIWHLHREDIQGKSVIEVGSTNVNGTLRDHVRYFNPASYLGVDVAPGPGVDQVCNAENLIETFGTERFDVLITTEMLEHVRDWRKVIDNLKQVVVPGGLLFITTRSLGFPFHMFPDDFWRYEPEDFQLVFADFHMRVLMPDPSEPGVFMKAVRPLDWTPADLSSIALYSMQTRERTLGYEFQTTEKTLHEDGRLQVPQHDLRSLQQVLDVSRKKQNEMQAQLDNLLSEREAVRLDREQLSKELNQCHTKLSLVENVVAELQRRNAELEEQFGSLDKTYSDLREAFKVLNKKHAELQTSYQALRQDRDSLSDSLAGVVQSRSWRLTAPLRLITENYRKP